MPAFTRSVAVSYASSGLVRSMVANHLIRWNVQNNTDTALLVMGELFNNAVRVVSIAQTLTVHVALKDNALILAVKDSSSRMPYKKNAPSTIREIDACDEKDLGGWGLALVEALSEQVWTHKESDGKWVCARIKV